MSDDFNDMFKDDVDTSVDTSAALGSIEPLVHTWKEAQDKVKETEAILKQYKEEMRRLEYVDIPSAMAEVGLAELKTADGLTVSCMPFVDGGINKPKEEMALAWLVANDYGDIIKTKLELSLGRGERAKAELAAKEVEKALGVSPAVKESVHAQTMKAFLRQCEVDGVVLPEELFRVYRGNVAKIKPTKK
jgi:hypothetical protein